LDEGEARMTIAMFDDKYELVCESKEISEVEEFTEESYVPRGTTALNDAIGRTIMAMGEVFSKRKEEDKPEKVVFVILTDGAENASKEYDLKKVKSLVEQQQNEWSWEFIFLSSDMNAFKQGAGFGIAHTSRMANTGKAQRATYGCLSDAVMSYRKSGTVGKMKKNIE
jgi:Mg-chelatase subunit ChlD